MVVVKVSLSIVLMLNGGWWERAGQAELSSFFAHRGSVGKLPNKHGSSKTRLGPQRSPHPCSSGLLDRPCQAPTQPISHTRPANQSRAGLIV